MPPNSGWVRAPQPGEKPQRQQLPSCPKYAKEVLDVFEDEPKRAADGPTRVECPLPTGFLPSGYEAGLDLHMSDNRGLQAFGNMLNTPYSFLAPPHIETAIMMRGRDHYLCNESNDWDRQGDIHNPERFTYLPSVFGVTTYKSLILKSAFDKSRRLNKTPNYLLGAIISEGQSHFYWILIHVQIFSDVFFIAYYYVNTMRPNAVRFKERNEYHHKIFSGVLLMAAIEAGVAKKGMRVVVAYIEVRVDGQNSEENNCPMHAALCYNKMQENFDAVEEIFLNCDYRVQGPQTLAPRLSEILSSTAPEANYMRLNLKAHTGGSMYGAIAAAIVFAACGSTGFCRCADLDSLGMTIPQLQAALPEAYSAWAKEQDSLYVRKSPYDEHLRFLSEKLDVSAEIREHGDGMRISSWYAYRNDPKPILLSIRQDDMGKYFNHTIFDENYNRLEEFRHKVMDCFSPFIVPTPISAIGLMRQYWDHRAPECRQEIRNVEFPSPKEVEHANYKIGR
jgi:hypothetical protein